MCSLGKQIEKLDIKFSSISDFIFSCDLLSHMPSLKYLGLKYCDLQPNFSSHCHSLKTLRLSGVKVSPGSLECLLSNCLSLTTLLIKDCELPEKLGLRCPQVKCIKIYDWSGNVSEVELYAGNLIMLEFFDQYFVDILFDYVPQLQHIYLVSFKYLRTLAKDMPLLESVRVRCLGKIWYDEDIQRENIFKEAFLFNHVKRLELSLDLARSCDDDVLSLMPLLHCCPVLQEFHLALLGYRRCKRWEKSIAAHRELKKVEISGYRDELELVSYILRSAVSLQHLHVSWFSYRYYCFGKWDEYTNYCFGKWDEYTSYFGGYTEEEIEIALGRIRALEPLAASKTVQVVAERSPRRTSKQDEIWAEEPYL